jgi:raffinose/stachyose/melibiose transport system substrate-binding protein
MSEPKKVGRRTFLNYAIAVVATGVIVGAATYFAVPKGVTTVTAPGTTVTTTKTVTTTVIGTQTTTPTTSPTAVTTSPTTTTSPARRTIVFWSAKPTPPLKDAVDVIVSNFKKQHPDIDIEYSVYSAMDLRAAIKTALTGGVGPDVFEYDAGPSFTNVLAKAGLLYDLTPFYKKYGWDNLFLQWAIDYLKVTVKGKQGIYGLPAGGPEIYVIYYNATLFSKLGLSEPKTWEEFEQLCQTLKDKGYIPLPTGNKGKTKWMHWTGMLFEAFAGGDLVHKAMYNQASWTSKPFVDAIKFCQLAWEKEWINHDFQALDYTDAMMLFEREEAAMFPSGTYANFYFIRDKAQGNFTFDINFFALPPRDKGIDATVGAIIGDSYNMNASSKYPDEAAEFLDFFFSLDSQKVLMSMGAYPSFRKDLLDPAVIASIALPPGYTNLMVKQAKLGKDSHLLAMNATQPSYVNDYMTAYAQDVCEGKISAEEYMKEVDNLWQKFFKEEGY